ncbi:MAG: cyclase family protein [Muricoprocola sp.]
MLKISGSEVTREFKLNEKVVYEMNGLRIVDLTKGLDPKSESRRCHVHRYQTGGPIPDWHSELDLTTHLGTHAECPFHHYDLDGLSVGEMDLDKFIGRGVYVDFGDNIPENGHITAADLDKFAGDLVKEGDIVIIDSAYKIPPFSPLSNTDADKRLFVNKETAEWFRAKGVKGVGFGDGVSIENCNEDVAPFHDVIMESGYDGFFIEVLKNLECLNSKVFFFSCVPLPLLYADSMPVRAYAIEGLPGFTE